MTVKIDRMWIIKDWADNTVFPHEFESFEDAEEFLCWNLDDQGLDYDENRQEYEITEVAA